MCNRAVLNRVLWVIRQSLWFWFWFNYSFRLVNWQTINMVLVSRLSSENLSKINVLICFSLLPSSKCFKMFLFLSCCHPLLWCWADFHCLKYSYAYLEIESENKRYIRTCQLISICSNLIMWWTVQMGVLLCHYNVHLVFFQNKISNFHKEKKKLYRQGKISYQPIEFESKYTTCYSRVVLVEFVLTFL